MAHVTRRIVVGAAFVVACGGVALRGQDPDGGAARGRPLTAHRPSVPGIHGLVTAGHPLAAMAGLQVLIKGGNAMDAAVAIGAALNMMEPQMNGIGGNGFMTVYEKKTGRVFSRRLARRRYSPSINPARAGVKTASPRDVRHTASSNSAALADFVR